MKTYYHNSDGWYADVTPLLIRLLRWFVRTGWEMPHWTRAGYSYRFQAWHCMRLALRARGHRSRLFAIYDSLCPLSLFGGRVTFQSFGVNYYSRCVKGWYCLHWGHGKRKWTCYRSHDATPRDADTWYIGAPKDVVRAAQAQHDRMDVSRREREDRERAAPMNWRRG